MIERISVRNLFGHLSYTLPAEGQMKGAAILYGENGTGKTTILKLVYHMLSPAPSGGHRTAIANIPFEFFSIQLSGGVEVRATKETDALIGGCLLEIVRDGQIIADWDYTPGTSRSSSEDYISRYLSIIDPIESSKLKGMTPVRLKAWIDANKRQAPEINSGERPYLDALSRINLGVNFLSAERQLYGDGTERRDNSYEMRTLAREESFARVIEKGHELALKEAMAAAWQWVASQAVASSNAGGDGANVVYTDIVKRLARTRTRATKTSKPVDAARLVDSLREIDRKSLEMAEYNLIAPSKTAEIVDALMTAGPSNQRVMQTVLEPFINGQRARIQALKDIYEITHKFVSTLNNFYRGKRVVLDLTKGMSIVNEYDGSELDPIRLSSGEQQLLLIFCHTLVSRARPSIFIIDEPEISLNVKWQRMLVQKLLAVAQGSDSQFIFASHSIELLTQHRDKLVAVRPSVESDES